VSRVLALVEGYTERAFVSEVLAPELGRLGIDLRARIVGKVGHKGGVRRFESVRKDLCALLRQEPRSFVTTMFDYYGLPSDWPGLAGAKGKPPLMAARCVEEAMARDICAAMGDPFEKARFIPYVQMHEFEALLFSAPAALANAVQCPSLKPQFEAVVTECGEPEGIDDRPEKCPSKRIEALARHYQKTVHGPIAAQRVGLARMRAACPHFAAWLGRLEGLGAPR